MAAGSLPLDRNKLHGAALYDAIRQMQQSVATMLSLQAIMVQMIDTAPNPDDFSLIGTNFCVNVGDGQSVKAELDSLLAKLATDDTVDHVLAARNQIAAKFGVV